MVPVIISIITCTIILVVGIGNIHRIRNQDLVGNLLVVHFEDEDEPTYMLEIFKGNSWKIKPGEFVLLHVEEEFITPQKQPS